MQETMEKLEVYYKHMPPVINECLANGIIYTIKEPNTYQYIYLNNQREGYRIYWHEMLQRAHMISITGIQRSLRLLEAIRADYDNKNMLTFSNNLRAFLESTGDIMYALRDTSRYFANHFPEIKSAIKGENVTQFTLSPELEERLLHYTEAKKLTKQERNELPEYYSAKQTQFYISLLDGDDLAKPFTKIYSKLCALSHPSAASVLHFLKVELNGSSMDYVYSFGQNQDSTALIDFNNIYEKEISYALDYAFLPCIVCLKVLNKFDIPDLRLKTVDSINPDIVMWREIAKMLPS